MMNIVKFPDPILRQQTDMWDFQNPKMDPIALEKELIETMFSQDGIGLAAPQVGLPFRDGKARRNRHRPFSIQ